MTVPGLCKVGHNLIWGLTLRILILRNSILALASWSICWASASSFLSRECGPSVMLLIMFSAPSFTFSSMLSLFSRLTSLGSWLTPSWPLCWAGVGGDVWASETNKQKSYLCEQYTLFIFTHSQVYSKAKLIPRIWHTHYGKRLKKSSKLRKS